MACRDRCEETALEANGDLPAITCATGGHPVDVLPRAGEGVACFDQCAALPCVGRRVLAGHHSLVETFGTLVMVCHQGPFGSRVVGCPDQRIPDSAVQSAAHTRWR